MDYVMMMEATSSDDSPTPGFMLTEIAKRTLSSYPACEQIEQFLLSRITKSNHNIKFKCLLIIKHVCRTGRLEFKRDLSRNVGPIKECLQFRGPPDPLRGDEIYKRVRELAKETVEAIFDSQMPVATSAVAASGRIQGIEGGSAPPERGDLGRRSPSAIDSAMNRIKEQFQAQQDSQFVSMGPGGGLPPPHGGGSYLPSSGGGGGSSGFGNPNFEDARYATKSTMEIMQSGLDMAAAALKFDPHGKFGESGGSGYGGGNSFSQGPGGQGQGGYNYASNRGPGAINGAYHSEVGAGSSLPGGNGKPWPEHMQPKLVPEGANPSPSSPQRVLGEGRAGKAKADGSYEHSTVVALCEASGLKAVPDPDKFKQFLIDAATLSPELVGCSLLDQLNEDAWQCRAKALQVVAGLGGSSGCEAHRRWWAGDAETVEDLQALAAGDPKGNVRSHAQKALMALKIDTSSLISTAGTSSGPASSQTNIKGSGSGSAGGADLLEGFGGSAEQEKAPSQAALTDIFGDAASNSAPSKSNTGSGSMSLLEEMGNIPAVPVTTGQGESGGLVGIIDTSQSPQHSPPPVPMNTAATAQSDTSDLLFQGMSMNGTGAAISSVAGGGARSGGSIDLLGALEGKSDTISPLSTSTTAATGTDVAVYSSNAGSDLLGKVGGTPTATTSSGGSTTAAKAGHGGSGFGFISNNISSSGGMLSASVSSLGSADPVDNLLGGKLPPENTNANTMANLTLQPTPVSTDMVGGSGSMNTMRYFQGMQSTDPAHPSRQKPKQEPRKDVRDLLGDGFTM